MRYGRGVIALGKLKRTGDPGMSGPVDPDTRAWRDVVLTADCLCLSWRPLRCCEARRAVWIAHAPGGANRESG